MRSRMRKVVLMVLAGMLALGLVAFVWTIDTASSAAQQDAMQPVVALRAVVGSATTPTPTPTPAPDTAGAWEWTVTVDGLVQSPLSLALDDLVAMPASTVYAEDFCVAQPTIPLAVGDWTGVRLGFILNQAGVLPEAWKVAFYADDGFSTDLPLTTAMRDDIILAYERDGEPLTEKQLVVPCKWGYKWIREPTHIELVDYDFLGTFESGHYSDEANRTPGDVDCDGVSDADDNCESAFNLEQSDTDGDTIGDACDTCPNDPDNDIDGDGICGDVDNCPDIPNSDQINSDGGSHGDACDNCPEDDNPGQEDSDGDGTGDVCEPVAPPQPTPSPTPTITPTPGVTPTPTPELVETPEATPTAVTETCAPVFPGTYNGSVRLDGVPAPSGAVLKALVGGTEWASTTVAGGLYVLDIPETLPATPPCFEGGTITFVVDGYVCSPSPDWASSLHGVDVSCEVAPTPTPEPTPEVTPTPGVTPTPVAPPPTGGGGLLNGGSAAWTAAVAAGGVLAVLLTAVGLSRGARRRWLR